MVSPGADGGAAPGDDQGETPAGALAAGAVLELVQPFVQCPQRTGPVPDPEQVPRGPRQGVVGLAHRPPSAPPDAGYPVHDVRHRVEPVEWAPLLAPQAAQRRGATQVLRGSLVNSGEPARGDERVACAVLVGPPVVDHSLLEPVVREIRVVADDDLEIAPVEFRDVM